VYIAKSTSLAAHNHTITSAIERSGTHECALRSAGMAGDDLGRGAEEANRRDVTKGSRGYLSTCTSQESAIPFLLEHTNPWSRSRAASRLATREAHLVPPDRWRVRAARSAGIKIDFSRDSQDRAKRVETSRRAVACFHGV